MSSIFNAGALSGSITMPGVGVTGANNTGAGASGSIYSLGAGSGFNSYNTSSAITIDGGANGSMRVDVPLLVNGRDVMKEIDEMRDAMLLLKRHVDMEDKYPKLKKIKDEYERALAKYKTFDAIKESK
jgi:hypothetical protein